jgi:hypothetical protein
MRRIRGLLLTTLPLSGCGGWVFTEENDRQTVEVAVGSTFSISVPNPPESPAVPVYDRSILRVDQEVAEDGRLRFAFQALNLGESEIRIGPDFVLRVRVRSAIEQAPVPFAID